MLVTEHPPGEAAGEVAQPDSRIAEFIRKHHVMTLATCADGIPYCASLFYTYLKDENCFVVTSSEATRHAAEVVANPRVAGSIALETRIIGKIQGVQFQGVMERPEGERRAAVRKKYLAKFPYAAVMDLELWIITPSFLKLTDNRLGFGKKLIWHAPQG